MTKVKKTVIGILAAGIATSAVCISASASVKSLNNQLNESSAVFVWHAGYAEMTNLKQLYRHASAWVEVFDNVTGKLVDSDTDVDDIGYYESVSAQVNGYSINSYNFNCYGTISCAGGQYAPIDWSLKKNVPE